MTIMTPDNDKKPKGWLSKIFGRKAKWWMKALRTTALIAGGLMATDRLVLPNLPGRPLTRDETAMLQDVYKDSVDFTKVRIHNSPLADVFLNWMGADAVARDNLIYMSTTMDMHNYGAKNAEPYIQYALTHEAAHVWQHQNGVMPNVFHMTALNIGRFFPGKDRHEDYRYSVLEGKDLLQYNIEQQAGIITDFAFAAKGTMPAIFENNVNAPKQDVQAGYEATLKNFRANPSYPRNR